MKSIGELVFIGFVTLLLLVGSVYVKIKKDDIISQELTSALNVKGYSFVGGRAGKMPLVHISDWSINDSLSKSVFYDHAFVLSNDTIYSLTTFVDSLDVEYDFVLTQILNQNYSFK